MRNPHFVLVTGECVSLNDVFRLFPISQIYNSQELRDVTKICSANFFQEYGASEDEMTLFQNCLHLFHYSSYCFRLAALLKLCEAGMVDRVLYCTYDDDTAALLRKYNTEVVNALRKNLISRSTAFKFFPILVVNWVFRFLSYFGGIKRNKVIFRCSVENLVRTNIDANEYVYLVYPTENLVRQIRFLKQLKTKSEPLAFAGLPFSLLKLLGVIFSKRLDLRFVKFLAHAAMKHAREFDGKCDIERIVSADEFQPYAFLFHRHIRDSLKVTTDNYSHGVGFYGPNIGYSNFHVFNKLQSNHYSNQGTSFHLLEHALLESRKQIFGLPLRVVFLLSNRLASLNLEYEYKLEDEVMQYLAGRFGEKFLVKLHPNTSVAFKQELSSKNFKFFDGQETDVNYVAITVMSAAVYDAIVCCMRIAIKDQFFNPSCLFGNDILVAEAEEIETILEPLLNYS